MLQESEIVLWSETIVKEDDGTKHSVYWQLPTRGEGSTDTRGEPQVSRAAAGTTFTKSSTFSR